MFGRTVLVVIALTLFSGCAENQRVRTNCPMGRGADCKSVTEVNRMVNSGELENKNVTKKQEQKMTLHIDHNFKEKPRSLGFGERREIKRIPEETGRVWMSRFEDEAGDYVKETYVYTVLKSGRWEDVQ